MNTHQIVMPSHTTNMIRNLQKEENNQNTQLKPHSSKIDGLPILEQQFFKDASCRGAKMTKTDFREGDPHPAA